VLERRQAGGGADGGRARAQKLLEAAEKQQAPGLMLRVAVEGGGCSGFKYVYEFERQTPSADEDV
jgi:Fe-S cluster assembly iron-binding protein IscA